jgi:RecA/RadA recombinase
MGLDDLLDDIEVDIGLSQIDVKANKLTTSTGLLSLDLMLSGGMVTGGWYTMFGGEQSCKSTLVMTQMARAVDMPIPYILYFDYEGSFDSNYFLSIARHVGVIPANMPEDQALQRIFGLKDDKNKWVVQPRVRYYPMSIGEKFFDFVAKLQRTLPDKLFKNNKWWLVYDDTKEHKKIIKEKKLKHDDKLLKSTGKYWIETDNGYPQAIIAVDSYPAMMPGKQDVDDPNNAIGMQARMFADNLKRVKGKMSAKRITVMGVNQLRLKPMVSFGNPEYEPGGEALKFNCFSADTLLTTSKGLLYADELYYKRDTLPAIQGVASTEQPPIYDFMGESELIKLTTRGGYNIKGKPGHRVLALRNGSFAPRWTALEDIKIQASSTYYVPLKVGAGVFNTEQQSIDYTGTKFVCVSDTAKASRALQATAPDSSSVELAYLLGYFVSEGHHKDNYLVLTNKDCDLIEHLVHCYAQVFDLAEDEVLENYVKSIDDKFEFRVYDSSVSQILTYVGLQQVASHEKSVPWIIRQGTKEEQAAFLSALFEGDGTAQSREISYFSLSEKLLFEVQQMLLNFGIYCKNTAPKIVWRTTDDSSAVGSLYLSGHNASTFATSIGFVFDRKQSKFDVTFNATNSMFDILPKFLGWTSRKKLKEYVEQLKGKSNYFKLEHFAPGWFEDATEYVSTLRTEQERRAMLSEFKALKKFIEYTRKNNLLWLDVTDIDFSFVKSPTFDANMPDTHTILTNGLVSHNSDVRIRMASRSVQGGSGQIEEEEGVKGGVDQYRYIHMRAHKNKLSVPNLEGWARVWVRDAEGQAHGFDPVYDVFHFCKELGIVSGTKNRLKFDIAKMKGHKAINWLNFKKLVIGDKKMIKEVLTAHGVTKPFFLRDELFKLVESGKAIEMYFAKKKNDYDGTSSDDDDDEDDE